MSRSPIAGRRIHISGSISADPTVANPADVEGAQKLVAGLVRALMRKGANFVVPVDAEPKRADGYSICFDWIVWQAISDGLALRPAGTPGPLAVGVLHHKTEEQIPVDRVALWDELRDGPNVKLESAAQWNMASKRMEAQARYGDILITFGGAEGVIYLANLYHEAGRPVVPLDLALVSEGEGSRRLNAWGMASSSSRKLFQLADGGNPHDWMNRIRFPARRTVEQRIETLVDLIEALERPRAFAVRLLNDEHAEYPAVQDFFDNVVRPVVEDDLGYRLAIIDGRQAYDHARIDQEIFAKLHRSALTIADLTGSRPNCFLELGYSLGRTLPTVVTARKGFDTPFDIATFAGHHWKASGDTSDRRRAFKEHLEAVRNRPPLVESEGLLQ
ncbi:hypothetical protein GRI75_09460 [Altererythrobacter soli]|uniref:ATP nucleosidase Cap17-like N-terminal domain-containing protein n=1 Tax=Croceibacterium soli TaxID=1739690 RepID=A0A6I4UWR8_9SPHN|nr:hypothetical protein [Croceibacterium soli]MXP41867.1 hypothetical protein [Croceibacterium soli]